jgi:Flp pilus assembly protein TadB
VTVVVALSVIIGLGLLGFGSGLRTPSPPLDVVWASWQRPADPQRAAQTPRTGVDRLAVDAARYLAEGRLANHARAQVLREALAVTDVEAALFASRLVVIVGVCALAPISLWFVLQVLGAPLPLGPVVLLGCVAPPIGVAIAVASLLGRARERRRHVRIVLGSFVDLVVLSLAGGVGIDGAMHAASQVTPDWAARRMATALRTARDGGTPPWDALASLGTELGVPELVELATTVQLAGTEGARIRQALMARGASIRRHEQAEAESAANAMTERLFIPGTLLLLGFLLFIGYPAVQRILGGF